MKMVIDFNILNTKNVWNNRKKIVLNKFLKGMGYTLLLAGLTFGIEFISTSNIPQEWVLYTGLIIALLQSGKKALEKYEPVKYMK